MAREKVKLLIVDDHPVFREGLRQCLEAGGQFQVVAAAGGGEEMWRALRAQGRPQVVLMDVEMPGESGIDLTQTLREKEPDVRVVMLTAHADPERVFAALKAGAVGYLLKNVSPPEIRATVERAAAGEPILSAEIAGRVLREFERERGEARDREQLADLTPREEEILRLGVRPLLHHQGARHRIGAGHRAPVHRGTRRPPVGGARAAAARRDVHHLAACRRPRDVTTAGEMNARPTR